MTTRMLLLLTTALLAATTLWGQPRQFTEEFTDNSRGWFTTSTTNARVAVERGAYLFDIRQEPFFHSWYNLELSENSAFVLSTEIQHWGGVNQYGYGMYLAGQSSDNAYLFLISANGHYTFGRLDDGRWIPTQPWTASPAIRIGTGQINELSFAQREREWVLSINGQEQFRTQRQAFYGGNFGFSVENYQQVAFNRYRLVVGTLPAEPPASTQPSQPAASTAGPAPSVPATQPATTQPGTTQPAGGQTQPPATESGQAVFSADFCFSFNKAAEAASKGYEGSTGAQRPKGPYDYEDVFDTNLQLAGAQSVTLSRTTHNPLLRLIGVYADTRNRDEATQAYEQLLQRLQVCLPELSYEEQRREEPNAMFLRTATWRPSDTNSVVGRQFRELLLVVRLTRATAYDDRFQPYNRFEVTLQLSKFR